MSDRNFIEKLSGAIDHNNSLLCVGLDPNPQKFPHHFPKIVNGKALLDWGKTIIEQTADLVCCYKPNFAFYEQYGTTGLDALRQTIAAVPADIPVLLDVKRGDIGSTAAAYARAAFEVWGADAATINPYLGQDSVAPFLEYPGKMVFLLGYTSNPSAKSIQEFGQGDERLFEHIIQQGQGWGTVEQVGFVIGATQPQALARFRTLAPDSWVLAPGIGTQGGDLEATLAAGLNSRGSGLIVPVSRAVLYADNPRQAALSLRDEINRGRQNIQPGIAITDVARTELIIKLYEAGSVQFGQFTLASGRQSPIYIDLRRIASDPVLLKLVAHAYAKQLKPLSFDHLAAVPYAALTIGAVVAFVTENSLIYPRKELKSYGTGRSIEGVFSSGDRVAVIEDLVTSGGSVLKAIETLEAAELVISDVVVLIDRQQGGDKNLADKGYRLHAVFNITEILETLRTAGKISIGQLEEVREYLSGG